ncbi:hypothetical protein [Streptomyces genisteinicus]|uniref:Uncharacterized protein n=1 Tax=Streptomyces genisteinicus TaxID=2768068 RepID=A0A7H0HYX7_9ACTN|nr:hypothetical protein [Streptomyces genisteinicus]QNP65743.1 hypothetical protein IAG43_24280 [Streptomyces genisteinicus]
MSLHLLINKEGSQDVAIFTLRPILKRHEDRAAVRTVGHGADLPTDPDESGPSTFGGEGEGLAWTLASTCLQIDREPVMRRYMRAMTR